MSIKMVGRNWMYDDTNENIGAAIGNVLGSVMAHGMAREKDGDYKGTYVGKNQGSLTDEEAYLRSLDNNPLGEGSTTLDTMNPIGTVNNAIDRASDAALADNKFAYYSKLNGDSLHDTNSQMINDQHQGTKYDVNNFMSPFVSKLNDNTSVASSPSFDGTELKKNILKASSRFGNGSYNNTAYSPYNNPFLK